MNFIAEACYDDPVSAGGAVITTRAAFHSKDHGSDFTARQTCKTGNNLQAHFGYLLRSQVQSVKIQPYISCGNHSVAASNARRLHPAGKGLPTFYTQRLIMPNIKDTNATAYWKENLRYLTVLLIIWFAVSYGAGILFKEPLDEIRLGGFKLGFWFAQQGSIYVFVILIFVYVRLMNTLDRKYGYDE